MITDAAATLILNARAEAGSDAPVSEGSVQLAEWIERHADPVAAIEASPLSIAAGGGARVFALLAGALLPSSDLAETIGRETGGAVEPRAFWRQTEESLYRADAAAEATPPVLGEVPPGPLFVAQVIGGAVRIRGMGGQIDLSIAAVQALCVAISRALDRQEARG